MDHEVVFEKLYARFNRPEFVHPDPLELVRGYRALPDREVAGLIAACLAYGRVAQILKSAGFVLDSMEGEPASFICRTSARALRARFRDFRHRFASGENLSSLLAGIRTVLRKHGSLENCFRSGWDGAGPGVFPALPGFIGELSVEGDCGHLLPDPSKGSACKRIHLFLRWLVRRDSVDPGGWNVIDSSRLVVPMDTHMRRIGHILGYTRRSQTNAVAAMEITDGFRKICPEDPVKYDFSLTRLGIRGDSSLDELTEMLGR